MGDGAGYRRRQSSAGAKELDAVFDPAAGDFAPGGDSDRDLARDSGPRADERLLHHRLPGLGDRRASVGHLETDGVEHYLHVTEKRNKKRRKILLDAARPLRAYIERAGIGDDKEGPLFGR